MEMILRRKEPRCLVKTSILYQTSLWSSVKTRLGWTPYAFDFESSRIRGDMLVLVRKVSDNACIAYVPQGPETLPAEEFRGLLLESLSETLATHLPHDCIFIRYDLPWETPYARDRSRFDENGRWLGCPDPSLRELRMNIGTRSWNIRKSPVDIHPPDTVMVDLALPENEMLARMKPKTRYNIRLAVKKGVSVVEAGEERLPSWYRLYLQTVGRAGIQRHGYEYFTALFDAHGEKHDSISIHLLMATADGEDLAGGIISISDERATYLYGASSNTKRNYMATYALQWEAIRFARWKGCREYDFYGISPNDDPAHPMNGLYRFKTGFGGSVLHRKGCWDYPFKDHEYSIYRSSEGIRGMFHL